MRVIILAAGQGTRLRPLTDHRPKCLVALEGTPILERQLARFSRFNITDIHVATGYLGHLINYDGVNTFANPCYHCTNMVYTLFCGAHLFDGSSDVLISYGDIVYNDTVLKAIRASEANVSVVVDREWRRYWQARMPNPLADAETLKLDPSGKITELGKKPISYDQIEGQYIGLIKIKACFAKRFLSYYEGLDKTALYDGKTWENMYMTTLLQRVIDQLEPIQAVFIDNGWVEVDEPSDLKCAHFLQANK